MVWDEFSAGAVRLMVKRRSCHRIVAEALRSSRASLYSVSRPDIHKQNAWGGSLGLKPRPGMFEGRITITTVCKRDIKFVCNEIGLQRTDM